MHIYLHTCKSLIWTQKHISTFIFMKLPYLHKHTSTYSQVHTGKPLCAHTHILTLTDAHIYTCTYSNLHANKLHVHLYVHVLAHIHLHTNSRVHICKYRHACIYSHLHTTHGNPHEHMCIHYTCFCTCTHTHMYMMVICDLFNMVITTPGLRPTMKPEPSQFLPVSTVLISS